MVGTSGNVYEAGDDRHEFSIMSVSKPFVFALVCQAMGAEEAREKLGVNATGLAFNSLAAIERGDDGQTNPMVNSGAIATTSLVPGATHEARWQFIHDGLSRFAGRTLPLNDEVYASASETNYRNQSIARLLQSYGRIYLDPAEAIDLYTKQCSLNVTRQGPGGDGGDPRRRRGESRSPRSAWSTPTVCRYALAVMATAGLYETSGDWLFDIGLPGKSGIGGGIVTVSPGKGGLGTFAPPLDRRRQQRQGTAGGQVPVPAAGPGSVRLETRSVSGRPAGALDGTTHGHGRSSAGHEVQDSWVPMIVIAMGQMLMSFNVAALPVSMSGMVEQLQHAPHHRGHGDRDVLARRLRLRHAGRPSSASASARRSSSRWRWPSSWPPWCSWW